MKTEVVDGIEVVRVEISEIDEYVQGPCRWCVFRSRHHANDCPGDHVEDYRTVCNMTVFMRPTDYITFRLTGVPEEY